MLKWFILPLVPVLIQLFVLILKWVGFWEAGGFSYSVIGALYFNSFQAKVKLQKENLNHKLKHVVA